MAKGIQLKTENGMVDLPIEAERTRSVLLWSNPNPTSAFAGSTVQNIPDTTKYKYFIVEIAFEQGNGTQGHEFIKINGKPNAYLSSHWWVNSTLYIVARTISIYSNYITFGNGLYNNGKGDSGTSNNCCIPIAVYGTNSL